MILFNIQKSNTFSWPRFRVKAKAKVDVHTWIKAWAGVGAWDWICARVCADARNR
jgi:hypothetical protein